MTYYADLVKAFENELTWSDQGNPGGPPAGTNLAKATETVFSKLRASLSPENWLVESEELRAKAFHEALKNRPK